jgi:TolB protein
MIESRGGRKVSRLALTIGLLAAVTTAVVTSSSQATVPGTNGKIAFRRYLGPQPHPGRIYDSQHGVIFTINADGTGERRVIRTLRGNDGMPDWSPDGTRIAFRREVGPDGAIYSVRPNGSGLTRISPACPPACAENYAPAFSPDGQTVAYARQVDKQRTIVLVARDGGDEQVLVSTGSRAELLNPQFSPDGARLAFVQRNLGRTAPKNGFAIFVVNLDGTGLSRVTPWRLRAGDKADWSPDGTSILFRSNADEVPSAEATEQPQIYVIHPDGTGLKQLTHFDKGTIVASSSFSPDGEWIVFGASGVGGNADLYVMRSDGSGVRPLTRTKFWDSAPDWGPAR